MKEYKGKNKTKASNGTRAKERAQRKYTQREESKATRIQPGYKVNKHKKDNEDRNNGGVNINGKQYLVRVTLESLCMFDKFWRGTASQKALLSTTPLPHKQ